MDRDADRKKQGAAGESPRKTAQMLAIKPPEKAGAPSDWKVRLVHELPSRGYWVKALSFAGNLPLFIERISDQNLAVFFGKSHGKPYPKIEQLMAAGGKPLYIAYRKNQEADKETGRSASPALRPCVVWGEMEGKTYDSISDLTFANGLPLYVGRQGKWASIVWGTVEGKPYGDIQHLTVIAGQPFCLARLERNVWVAVWGTAESEPYEEFFAPQVEGNQIVVGARQGHKLYRLTLKLG